MTMDVNSRILLNRHLIFVLAISLFAIAGSVIVDSFLSIPSCKLCKIQRGGFLILIIPSFLGIFLDSKRIALWVAAIVSAAICFVALYHFGVQLGIVTDPCSVIIPKNIDGLKMLLFSNQTSCAKMTLLLGLPVSVWSLFLSFICFATAVRPLINKPQNE